MMAALGSDDASLKGDTDEGEVELTVGDETYRRILERHDGGVRFDSNPYLKDSETADLFAFLLERNDAREAVRRGGDLRDIIMRPVDTGSIQSQIEKHREKKRMLDEQLEELETQVDQLPELERERTDLESQIEETESALREKERAIEKMETSLEEASAEDDELDQARSRTSVTSVQNSNSSGTTSTRRRAASRR